MEQMLLFVVLYQIYKHVGTKHSSVRMQLKSKNGNFNFRIVHPAVNINVDYTIICHTQISLTRQGNSWNLHTHLDRSTPRQYDVAANVPYDL
jgi:predicted metalloprotease with PDZ domain